MPAWFYELHAYGTNTYNDTNRCTPRSSGVRCPITPRRRVQTGYGDGYARGPVFMVGPGWNFVGGKSSNACNPCNIGFWRSTNSILKTSTVPYQSAYTHTRIGWRRFFVTPSRQVSEYTRMRAPILRRTIPGGFSFARGIPSWKSVNFEWMKSRFPVRFETEKPYTNPGGSLAEHGSSE